MFMFGINWIIFLFNQISGYSRKYNFNNNSLCVSVLKNLLSLTLLFCAASAAPQLLAHAAVAAPVEDYDPHPQYSYHYDIKDSISGDSKSQSESRDGDVVHGSYSLVEADGSTRTVEYTADPVNGFNAVVHKGAPGAVAVAPAAPVARVAAPIAVARPAVAIAHAPVAVAHAPVAHTSLSTPHVSYTF